ncbi:hypothetical protein [Ruminococcus flavefaciens]|uniref:hypothetical protein n=1 Tax=Ruminococcus flavefaciens TaxID=1265 RepID=UPI0026F362A4|nr:hypothetical protein [Ruminococcus flavefaciens]
MSKKNTNSAAESASEAVKKASETAEEVKAEAAETVEAAKEAAADTIDLTENAAEATENVLDLTEDSDDNTEAEEAKATDEAAEKTEENGNTSEKADEGEKAEEAPVSIREKYHFDLLSKIIIWVVAAVIFIGAVWVTTYYVTTASKAEFHADCTDTIMWANATAESGHMYDKEFSYACFLPFSTSTIMVPLLHFFGLSMTAHIIGMMCFFLLLTIFLVFMIHEVTGSYPISLVGTGIFLSITLSTQKMREIFWGHTIYYSLGILFLVIGTFMYFRFLTVRGKSIALKKEGKNNKKTVIHKLIIFLCICLFVLFTGMDGITGFTLFALPFAGAIFAEQFVNTKYKILSGKTALVAFRCIVFLIMAVIGNMINNKLLGDMTAGYQEANSNFSPMEEWLEHFHNLPFAWMRLLGVKSLQYVKFASEEGIPNMIFLMASILIAVIPIIATCNYKKLGTDRRAKMLRIWIWMHWAVTAVNIMGYVFGVLAAADWRIIPMIGTSLIVSILFLCWSITKNADISRITVILFVPIFMAGYLHCNDVRKMKKDEYKRSTQYMLADFLEDEGVSKGYATFWNANSVTVITGESIKVSDVDVSERGVFMRPYQSSKTWYVTDPQQAEYFLLLSSYELEQMNLSDFPINNEPIRTAQRNINGTEFTLLVYDHNIAAP